MSGVSGRASEYSKGRDHLLIPVKRMKNNSGMPETTVFDYARGSGLVDR